MPLPTSKKGEQELQLFLCLFPCLFFPFSFADFLYDSNFVLTLCGPWVYREALFELDEFESALDCFQKAKALSPDDKALEIKASRFIRKCESELAGESPSSASKVSLSCRLVVVLFCSATCYEAFSISSL